MRVSKQTVAREWLIFLATFALAAVLSFFVGYYYSTSAGAWFAATIFLGSALYLSVILVRSIWWSIKTLNVSKRARYGIAVSIAALVVAAGGAIAIKNAVDRAQDVAKSERTPENRPESTPESRPRRTPEFDPAAFIASNTEKVEAADLRRIIVFDVTYDNIEEEDPERWKAGGFSDLLPDTVLRGRIKGRLRNELSRSIFLLKLTISFFNSDGKLIETQPVKIHGDFYPGGPTPFSGQMPRSLNLPEGSTWKVTVSEASYRP